MSRGRFITDFERDVIRIGNANGIEAAQIARFLKRSKSAVWTQIERMEKAGTLAELPFSFVADEIAEAIRNAKG